MALLPSASVTIDDTAGAFGGVTGYCVVIACCEKNADSTPRVFASTKSLLAQHGYGQGVDYAAYHFDETRLPVIFVGLPTVTAGAVGRQNSTGVVGTSVISVAAGAAGILDELDVSFTVTIPGTIGTSGIQGNLSVDGGRTVTPVKLGTATSYTIPYFGVVLNFGAGTLLVGDVYRFATTAPMWDSAGMAAARVALANQQKLARSFQIVGDLINSTAAGFVTSALNSYETANQRFAYARAQVRDRLPLATISQTRVRMTGSATITFAEVGATGDTITRSTGSFVTDGFVAGMAVDVSGSASNNFTQAKITAVAALVLTLDTQDLVVEGPTSSVVITGSHGLTFAEVGATGDTITRSGGSWLDDGFAVGDLIRVTGSASNNITAVAGIATLTATVLTLGTDDLAAEFAGSFGVTVVKGETQAAYVALMDSGFASVDAQKRIDLGLGRCRKQSPLHGSQIRRPVQWPLSLREYQHDLHIPTYRKSDGPLLGWDIQDAAGNTVVEFDERTDGGGLAARFSCARTYANGPNGTFCALSLTREAEGKLLSRTHNMSVANLACTVVHASTEFAIGQVLILDGAGRATDQSIGTIEESVNTDLEIALMQNRLGEGARATRAVWRASRTDILSTPGSTLNGVLDLQVNGTVEQIVTSVKVR